MSEALDAAQELSNRQYIKSRIIMDYPDLPVLITPFYFTSREDFIGQCHPSLVEQSTSLPDYKKIEASFAMIMWQRFLDLKPEICEDNPPVRTYYKIHLFQEFKDVRDDTTNSHDDMVSKVLTIRNRMLRGNDISPLITQFPLSCLDNLRRNENSEFLIGVRGDFIDLQVTVESR